VILLLLALGCRPEEVDRNPVVLTVDGVESEAAVQFLGDPDLLYLTVTPVDAVVAGVPFESLDFILTGLALDQALSYTHWVVVAVEGNLVDARFVVDGASYRAAGSA